MSLTPEDCERIAEAVARRVQVAPSIASLWNFINRWRGQIAQWPKDTEVFAAGAGGASLVLDDLMRLIEGGDPMPCPGSAASSPGTTSNSGATPGPCR